MDRRKFLIGAGSLAAGSAAAIGTGAFTSVSANRKLTVETADDADALLAMEAEDTKNGDEYVDETGNAISIDISTDNGDGVNDDATTYVNDLLKITNQGTQNVYVWAQGLPDGVRMYHDSTSGYQNHGTGAGNNQGAFSDTSNLNVPDDPADANDPANPGGYEAAPLLAPGDEVSEIGLVVDTTNGEVNFDDDIVIKAVAESEV
ncbi:hypothetical protein [Halorussus salinisoli]|uniref:hypothetical protein n=1 Tax=Halorussus salinisoli TaxID=2558242 RepID=UPI0010C17C02|nr:hypothetical protein [Halorussus salinisoli]